ncbi:ChbG/HpnK family deacetylase [Shigella flexneri]
MSGDEPILAIGMHFVLIMGKPLDSYAGVNPRWCAGKMDLAVGRRRCFTAGRNYSGACQSVFAFHELFGRKPTHLDSHHHVHMFPQIFPIVVRFAAEQGIALRMTVSRYLTLVIYRLICAVRRDSVARFMVKRSARHCSCKCWMIQPSRGRSLEVMCHPALSII